MKGASIACPTLSVVSGDGTELTHEYNFGYATIVLSTTEEALALNYLLESHRGALVSILEHSNDQDDDDITERDDIKVENGDMVEPYVRSLSWGATDQPSTQSEIMGVVTTYDPISASRFAMTENWESLSTYMSLYEVCVEYTVEIGIYFLSEKSVRYLASQNSSHSIHGLLDAHYCYQPLHLSIHPTTYVWHPSWIHTP
jgi:hypothetical protein